MLIASMIFFPVANLIKFVPSSISKDFAFIFVLSTGIIYLVKIYPIDIRKYGFHSDVIRKTIL